MLVTIVIAMKDIRAKVWSKLEYKNPKDWLLKLDKIERDVLPHVVYKKAQTLRTHKLMWPLQARQAGILTYGVGLLLDRTINFAMYEDSVFDYISRFLLDNIDTYVPVQLKDWVPESINQ